jgi:hypothetical protein
MSDILEKLGNPAGMDKCQEEGKDAKKKFSPPVLHIYGEVVKICQTTPEGQGEDEYGGPFLS